jgi:hypothetical protein
MKQMTTTDSEVSMNVSNYSNGTYIVKIADEDNSATLRFVKN